MPKRVMQGTVVKLSGAKTLKVEVSRRYRHPLYQKIVQRSGKYLAHDEESKYRVGDEVKIIESAPISSKKRWVVLEKL